MAQLPPQPARHASSEDWFAWERAVFHLKRKDSRLGLIGPPPPSSPPQALEAYARADRRARRSARMTDWFWIGVVSVTISAGLIGVATSYAPVMLRSM